jgi:hypothetical protein
MLETLDVWMVPDGTIRLFEEVFPAMHTAEAVRWKELSRGQVLSRLLELLGDQFLSRLPVRAWPDLVAADLSPAAGAVLLSWSLGQPGPMLRLVTGALAAHNWFSDPERGQPLVRELVALPPDRLAVALETISVAGRLEPKPTLRKILEAVQELGDDAAIQRFQAAIAWASAGMCGSVAGHSWVSHEGHKGHAAA